MFWEAVFSDSSTLREQQEMATKALLCVAEGQGGVGKNESSAVVSILL